MLINCSNPKCSVQFSDSVKKCPSCGALQIFTVNESDASALVDYGVIEQGKSILLGAFCAHLLTECCIVLGWLHAGNANGAITAAIRLGLSLLLIVAVYQGKEWARFALLSFLGLAILYGSRVVLKTGNVLIMGITAAALFYFYFLSASPSVLAFLESQRGKRSST